MVVIPGESLDSEQQLHPRPRGRLGPEQRGSFAVHSGAHKVLLVLSLIGYWAVP